MEHHIQEPETSGEKAFQGAMHLGDIAKPWLWHISNVAVRGLQERKLVSPFGHVTQLSLPSDDDRMKLTVTTSNSKLHLIAWLILVAYVV